MKLQGAMEYLNSYIWAILIIAVVLIVMIQLNIFNPNFWAPKQQPGSCSIIRIQLGGASLHCTGNSLIPEFVAQTNGNGIITGPAAIPQLSSSQGETIFMWTNLEYSGYAGGGYLFLAGTGQNNGNVGFHFYETAQSTYINTFLQTSVTSYYCGMGNIPLNGWSSLAATYNGIAIAVYVNGQQTGTCAATGTIAANSYPFTVGGTLYGSLENYYGMLSNVQFYNTSLTSSQINTLYLSGLGGSPIQLRNLVLWWPLNGDTNDYSGLGNSGKATNIQFTDNWYSNYVRP